MMKKKTLAIAIGLVVICLIAGFTAWGPLAARKTDDVANLPTVSSPLQACIALGRTDGPTEEVRGREGKPPTRQGPSRDVSGGDGRNIGES
jgi:hypothetical protein